MTDSAINSTAPAARRVALLARPGVAGDRLRMLLAEAGIESVLQGDPGELSAEALAGARPDVVLVVLEAASDPDTGDALEQLESVLADPAIDVVYEEAELAAAREGWEAARWKRHLLAKLQGHGRVLPPHPEGAVDEPAVSHFADATGRGNGAEGVSALDNTGNLPTPAPETETETETETDSLSLDDAMAGDIGPEVESTDVESRADEVSIAASPGSEPLSGLDEYLQDLSVASSGDDAGPDAAVTGEVDVDAVDDEPRASDSSFGELTLDDGNGDYAPVASQAADARFSHDLADLDARIASFELVDDAPAETQRQGAVLVMAGIGGPDAVRQFLGAVPAGFPRPILVQQRLDGGRYDRLVAQMQRATAMPVQLGEPGNAVEAGSVYVMPAGLGIETSSEGLRFSADDDVLAALPSADSAVLMLSGSDPADVDAVLRHGVDGALVAGQAAEGCYDPAAPGQLAARGGELAPPVELAQRLAERWKA